MAGIFGTFCYMNLSSILTESSRIIAINSAASFLELILHALKVISIFQDTFSEDQSMQIWSGLIASFIAFAYLSIISFIRKHVENGYWSLAQTNFEKSENLTKEVIQAIEAKDTFVSSLSHEVRNVLNALNGSIEHLSLALKNSSYMQVLKNAKLSGEILLNLVNNALDAAKIKADKLELSYGSCDFDDVLRKTFIVNAENLKNKNILAQALVDNDVPKEIWIDSGRVLQVLMNLVSNAIKFTPNNGRIFIHAKWIEGVQDTNNLLSIIEDEDNQIRESKFGLVSKKAGSTDLDCLLESKTGERYEEFDAEKDSQHRKNINIMNRPSSFNIPRIAKTELQIGAHESWSIRKVMTRRRRSSNAQQRMMESHLGYLKVQVSDNGCGIAEQNLCKLFGMYNQANSSISSTYGGTGLGLWISKQLTQKMNGDIAVYSERNKGTQFVFYLPVNVLQTSSLSTAATLKPLRDKVSVLVVDDFAFNRNLHKLLLEREGAQVTLANDGNDALLKYKQKGIDYFDVLMMDVNMPGMDGFSCAIKIREWEEMNNSKKVPIYFVSGDYFSEDDVVTGLKARGGFRDLANIRFLRKPIELEVISNIIKKFS